MIKRMWRWLRAPSHKSSILFLFGFGFIAGIIFWGGFHTVVEATNTEKFCIGCHEMKENVYKEYKETIHYSNRTGVRAICTDCHVPKSWGHKMIRKIKASREIYSKLMGTVSTPEKFEANRLRLAKRVWETMKSTDSRECRNCHGFQFMNLEEQDKTARKKHKKSLDAGKTCIDCHKGIAHKLPKEPEEAEEEKEPEAKTEAGDKSTENASKTEANDSEEEKSETKEKKDSSS